MEVLDIKFEERGKTTSRQTIDPLAGSGSTSPSAPRAERLRFSLQSQGLVQLDIVTKTFLLKKRHFVILGKLSARRTKKKFKIISRHQGIGKY
jgi:hypothetical protein